jgi:cyanate lyase
MQSHLTSTLEKKPHIQSHFSQVSRLDLTAVILDAKVRKGLSFKELADGTGLSLRS